MSVDRSLRIKGGLLRQRNVWTRAERIAALKTTQKWEDGDPVLGLPKVRTAGKVKKKKKDKKAEAEAEAEGTETPAAEE